MAWNFFKYCSGLRVVGSLMIFLVAAIIGVTYYAIVITIYGPQMFHGGSETIVAFVIVIIFHLLLVMLIWCYFMVVLTDPGGVPPNWRPMIDEEDVEAHQMAISRTVPPGTSGSACPESLVSNMDEIQDFRYCNKCENYKPPRCHHCRVCQRCILKMDHHCVWVVNCVGARNYKFFLLFLIYTFLETTLDTFVLLPHFINFFKDVEHHAGSSNYLATTFLAFVLNIAFALSLLGFLILHSSLVLANTTTIEVYEKKKTSPWRYDMGRRRNFEQVFGMRKLYWLIPLYAEEDIASMPALQGLEFPVRPDVEG
uniref:S-acyltransferase n=1 Tax=Wollemia nobilis TaxID=56998 RepID=A0A0C9QWU6_9CONI